MGSELCKCTLNVWINHVAQRWFRRLVKVGGGPARERAGDASVSPLMSRGTAHAIDHRAREVVITVVVARRVRLHDQRRKHHGRTKRIDELLVDIGRVGLLAELHGAECARQADIGIAREQTVRRVPSVLPRVRSKEAAAAERGVRLRIELEVDTVTSILDLVSVGIGYAVLPLNATTSDALKRRFQAMRITEPTLFAASRLPPRVAGYYITANSGSAR